MSAGSLPDVVLTREQVRQIDRLAAERYGIPGLVLMENAGRNAAEILDRVYGPSGSATIVCGAGNNGGDGCVIARHLQNRRWSVHVLMVGEESKMTPDTLVNWRIIRATELPNLITTDGNALQAEIDRLGADRVVIDALLGTGFRGQVRSPLAETIEAMNRSKRRAMVAIDVPSGLDCDTGVASNATIRADLTITFVAVKTGFVMPEAGTYLGRVEVADIGAPRELITRVLQGEG